ncbi:hypothetical protein EY643_09795 [Halioglobus maricola]|uniref:Uncharacterized protein n=1 Tax=Halioglobus maricola TaxID=2601894 RepID=A0A5P9NK14_9GAMM|nr:hypothetical protein [Halioglobus maricola]QFU75929.1 hypothetical protein EY643_09795 [Halioglobus maricola]
MKRPKLPEGAEDLELVECVYTTSPSPTVLEKEINRLPLDDERIAAAISATLPESLRSAHPRVRAFKSSLLKKPFNRYGFVESPYNSSDSLDIVVTEGSLQRACLLTSGLIKLCTAFGWEFGHASPKYGRGRGDTYFRIGEENVKFRIKERVTQHKRELTREDIQHKKKWGYVSGPKHEYDPTGKLTFSIEGIAAPADYKFKWTDSKKRLIEECIPDIIEAFIVAAEQQVNRTKERIESKRLYEIAAEKRRREEAKQRRQQEMISALVALAEEHERVGKINTLLEDMAKSYPNNCNVQTYIAEATRLLSDYAPLSNPDRFTDIFKHKPEYY